MKFLFPEIILTSLLSLVLCQSPWLGQFSFEYSFLLSGFLFLIVSISSLIRLHHIIMDAKQKKYWLLSYFFLLVFPLLIVLTYAAKHGLCSFTSGLQWFVLLPAITTFYAIACSMWAISYGKNGFKTWLIAWFPTLIFSAITLLDLYHDPSVFFYHPVLGYFPGPIYDEWIPKFSQLYTYRIWVVIFSFWLIIRDSTEEKRWKVGVLILFPLFCRQELGWHYSHTWIQRQLDNHIETKNAMIYFSEPQSKPAVEFSKQVDRKISKIEQFLHLPINENKVRIYVYPDSVSKKKWTGTQYTLVGNPMQRSLHVLSLNINDPILTHELTHVLASPMGIPVLHISPKIGLLEGLATAIQKSSLGISIDEWSRVMQIRQQLPNIAHTLGAVSFWKENPTRVYLASGSFVSWLIREYGIDKFKKVYRGENFDSTYATSLSSLIQSWEKYIQSITVTEDKMKRAESYLQEKPFYQKHCVHEVAEQLMEYSLCKDEGCEPYLFKACKLDLENIKLQKKCESVSTQ